jgi:hypothetical protein
MLPYNNQQLNTPFEHGVAFLLRVAEADDLSFVRQLRHVERYDQLTQKDQIEFCILLGEHCFFDDDHKTMTMADLLSSIKAMLDEEGQQ